MFAQAARQGARPTDRRNHMRRRSVTTQTLLGTACLSIAIGIGALAWASPAATPQGRVDAAYAAMGGDKIAALKTISLKAHLANTTPANPIPSTIRTSPASIR